MEVLYVSRLQQELSTCYSNFINKLAYTRSICSCLRHFEPELVRMRPAKMQDLTATKLVPNRKILVKFIHGIDGKSKYFEKELIFELS